MIAGSQCVNEGAVADVATTVNATIPRKRGCRHARPIFVRFAPKVEFDVPVFFEFENARCPSPQLALHEIEELLALI